MTGMSNTANNRKTLRRTRLSLLGYGPACIMLFSSDFDRARVQGLKGNDRSGAAGLQG